MDIFSILLPIVYIIVGAALVWFVIELAITLRKVRTTVTDMKKQLDPTLENVDKMVAELQPTMSKVDPLVDRFTLTVDSVNLELMRVDGILEDVSKISGSVSKTVDAVDTVTSAPLDIVTNVTKKVRSKFRPKYASEESVDLGSEGTEQADANPITEFVSVAGGAAAESVREEAERMSQHKQAREERSVAAEARDDLLGQTKEDLMDALSDDAAADAEGSYR